LGYETEVSPAGFAGASFCFLAAGSVLTARIRYPSAWRREGQTANEKLFHPIGLTLGLPAVSAFGGDGLERWLHSGWLSATGAGTYWS